MSRLIFGLLHDLVDDLIVRQVALPLKNIFWFFP